MLPDAFFAIACYLLCVCRPLACLCVVVDVMIIYFYKLRSRSSRILKVSPELRYFEGVD